MNAAEAPPRPARVPVVLIVPTRNEAQSIGAALAGVPREIVSRIIVADGGSTDGTAQRAIAAGAEVIDGGSGYGSACWNGALAAEGDAILIFMDGDGSDRIDLVQALIAPILSGDQDFVIASRVRGKREPGSMGKHQILLGLLIGRLVGLLYGFGYTDMCAFRAIRCDRLMGLGMREMGYGWNLEMQMRAAQAKLRILELPMPYRCRLAGESKVSGNLSTSLRAGSRILSTFFRIACARQGAGH